MRWLKFLSITFAIAFLAYIVAKYLFGVTDLPVLREFLYVGVILTVAARGLIGDFGSKAIKNG